MERYESNAWHQFAPLIESKKKVATVHAQNPQGTKENVRLSWLDCIAGNEYLPASNRQVVDITSHKRLGSGATYGKSMHAEIFSPPKLKQATKVIVVNSYLLLLAVLLVPRNVTPGFLKNKTRLIICVPRKSTHMLE
jgi:hypothetical protein